MKEIKIEGNKCDENFLLNYLKYVYVRAEFISLRSISPGCDLEGQSAETAACEKEDIKEKKKKFYRIRWGVHERDAECVM